MPDHSKCLSVPATLALPSLHLALRAATQEAHERLHQHAGFAAIQDSTIGLADYRDLIARLYGFYLPFEVALEIVPERTNSLAADLDVMGPKAPRERVSICGALPRLDSAYRRLGALYVAEGSALGGRALARKLDRLLGEYDVAGRRFFVGRGAGTNAAWKRYLLRLAAAPTDPSVHAEIIEGAVETFAAFEDWLNGWSTPAYG